MVGHTRSINGADGGVGIGSNRWLYCDATSGATWLMRIAAVEDGAGSVTFQVWLDDLFGQLGRQYSVVQSKLAEMTWSVPQPTWMTKTPTAQQLVEQLNLHHSSGVLAHTETAVSNDGSVVYVNLRLSGTSDPGNPDVRGDAFGPTNDVGDGRDDTGSLAGILRINVSGTSTPATAGMGISATIVEDLVYEGGIVSSYSNSSGVLSHSAILYRTPYGDLTRTVTINSNTNAVTGSISAFGQVRSLNGTRAESTGSAHHVVVFAQNAVYLGRHTFNSGSDTDWRQAWIVQNKNNVASVPWEVDVVISGYTANGPLYHGLPIERQWVASFDPDSVGGIFVRPALYRAAYAGETYQYI